MGMDRACLNPGHIEQIPHEAVQPPGFTVGRLDHTSGGRVEERRVFIQAAERACDGDERRPQVM
jgi:hypothetical protein